MHCIILISPGEVLANAHFIRQAGYTFDLYPSTQDTSTLEDSRYDESFSYLGRAPESAERAHVRSLRASFMRMISDTRYAGNEALIFCESDVSPCISANTLRPLIQELLAAHPEADVIRLFHTVDFSTEETLRDFAEGEIGFAPMEYHPERDINAPHVWGTHALIIPTRSRAKVAELFSQYRLPIDVTLEAAHGKGELNVLSCSANLFAQFLRREHSTPYKIGLLLSSYKRYSELQRQIWCMMDQDYPHSYHLFVAVKGIGAKAFAEQLIPQFQHYIDAGRLTLRHFPNKNQLSNILDTIRDIDLSAYDLYAKIDDDDIYTRNYLSTLNTYHQHLPRGIGSYFCGWGSYLKNAGGFPQFTRDNFWCYGPTMAFSNQVLEQLFLYESNPSQFSINTSSTPWHPELKEFGFAEDALIDRVNQYFGACNRASYAETEGHNTAVTVSQMQPSVTRGDYINPDFWRENSHVSHEAQRHESIIEAQHPHWLGLIRLLGSRATHLNTGNGAKILSFDGTQLVLHWDNWGEEIFKKDSTGIFQLQG